MHHIVPAALLCALALPGGRVHVVDGADYNKPVDTADVGDCIYPKTRTGIAAFAFDGGYFPFALDVRAPWPGFEHAPGSMRVLELQALTAGGRTTYMSRGGAGSAPSPRAGIGSPARPRAAAVRRPQRQRTRGAEDPQLPDLRAPDRAAGGGGIPVRPAVQQRRLLGQLRQPGRALRLEARPTCCATCPAPRRARRRRGGPRRRHHRRPRSSRARRLVRLRRHAPAPGRVRPRRHDAQR